MSKKTMKIIGALTVIVCVIMAVTPVFALIDVGNLTGEGYSDKGSTQITTMSNKIIGLIKNVGIAASVIILMVIGFKYLTGSVEEKADYKKSLMPYVVGAIILFGASTIAGFVIDFFK